MSPFRACGRRCPPAASALLYLLFDWERFSQVHKNPPKKARATLTLTRPLGLAAKGNAHRRQHRLPANG
eukprot:7379703-Prymnesium_polylepis.2